MASGLTLNHKIQAVSVPSAPTRHHLPRIALDTPDCLFWCLAPFLGILKTKTFGRFSYSMAVLCVYSVVRNQHDQGQPSSTDYGKPPKNGHPHHDYHQVSPIISFCNHSGGGHHIIEVLFKVV